MSRKTKRKELKNKPLTKYDKILKQGIKLGISEDYMDALLTSYCEDPIEFFDNLGDENLNEEQMNFIHAYFN